MTTGRNKTNQKRKAASDGICVANIQRRNCPKISSLQNGMDTVQCGNSQDIIQQPWPRNPLLSDPVDVFDVTEACLV